MSAVPDEMHDFELEVLFWAASTEGSNAGYIRWAPETLPNTLSAGVMSWQFSFDSARKEMYRDAVNSLVRNGYVVPRDSGGYLVSDAGYEVAETCCHEWWRRQFAGVQARRSRNDR